MNDLVQLQVLFSIAKKTERFASVEHRLDREKIQAAAQKIDREKRLTKRSAPSEPQAGSNGTYGL